MLDRFGGATIGSVEFEIDIDGDVTIEVEDFEGGAINKYISLAHLEQFVKEAREWLDKKQKGASD